MKILSVNAGSSSLKFTLFEMPEEKELINGVFERIGMDNSFYSIKLNGEKIKKEVSLKNHKIAFEILVQELVDNKIIDALEDIKGVGHRVAQGGAYFAASVLATPENLKIVEDLAPLAPLHNPPALTGVKAAMETFKDVAQTLVFDTSFHQSIPKENYIYPIPYEWYTKYGVRRYGFHGTSHKYVYLRVNELLGKNDTKVITCHIGNGASISAVKNGMCINTSMGLTPNAGLMMGTRCGDIDATILTYMMKTTGMSADEVENYLNKESGYLGVSGVSSDSRDIEVGIKNGDERCILAQDMYINRIVDYIARYYVELGGCDAIVFTAGIGENALNTRAQVINKLSILGIKLDEVANNSRGKEVKITTDSSKIPVYVIPTNEELMIASDTYTIIK
ncbi:MAG: acetate kinase [Bacilli bacterium]|nr:acetate kinase [Bacilli bacterium]